MAGEDNIDTGIGIGEAQVFNPYNKPSAQDQVNVEIERDRIGRFDQRKKEEAERLKAYKPLEYKPEGVIPIATQFIMDEFKELSDADAKANFTGAVNDLNYKQAFAAKNADFYGIVNDLEEHNKTFLKVAELYRNNKLSDEDKAIYEERFLSPDYYSRMRKSGKNLAEISGAIAGDLNSFREKEVVEPYTFDTKATFPYGYSNEDPSKGVTKSGVTYDRDMANQRIDFELEQLRKNPEKYKSAMDQYGDEKNLRNSMHKLWEANTSRRSGIDYDSNYGMNVNSGGGVARKGRLIIRLTGIDSKGTGLGNKTELTKKLGMDYVPTKGRKSMVFSWDDKDKMNVPVRMNSDETKKTQILGVPLGLEQNENGDWEYVLSVKNAGAEEGSMNEFREERVPYKGNETHTNELEGFESPDQMYDYAIKSMQGGAKEQADNTPKATNTVNYFKGKQ